MIDQVTLGRLLFRLLFIGLAAIVMFAGILPINLGAERIPGPDLVLLAAFAWVLRRPDYVPFLLAAAVFLIEDILFMRPFGLASGLGLIALEFLRGREPFWRELPFMFEWAMVSTVLFMLFAGQTAILALFFVDQAPLSSVFVKLSNSIFTYPVIVAVSRYALQVAKPAPGEVDALGHKI